MLNVSRPQTLLGYLLQDELSVALAGARPGFCRHLRDEAHDRIKQVGSTLDLDREARMSESRGSLIVRGTRRRLNDAWAALESALGQHAHRSVERYTGRESRTERDASAAAFC